MSEDVKKIRIEEYNYDLPDEKIARYPLPQRDQSKLLLAKAGNFSIDVFQNISTYLPDDSFIVFNETKVIQARLLFPKNEHTTIEIFCLEPESGMDIQNAMAMRHSIRYKCLVGGARKWKDSPLKITLEDSTVLEAEKTAQEDGVFIITFRWDSALMFSEILEKAGKTPLPPYLKRSAEQSDKERYQTIFAKNNGSVAAPTASLHFSDEVMRKLRLRGIENAKLTLHVGAGTFKPVSTDNIGDHAMHAEEISITPLFLETIIHQLDHSIIPVGTTAMRALESLYWLGAMALQKKLSPSELAYVDQWVPYELNYNPTPLESLEALLDFMRQNDLPVLNAKTALMIVPGYKHRICKGLITNFHQPKSTLLLLVASLLGDKWRKMYDFALKNDFRFLSYGDSCLILN